MFCSNRLFLTFFVVVHTVCGAPSPQTEQIEPTDVKIVLIDEPPTNNTDAVSNTTTENVPFITLPEDPYTPFIYKAPNVPVHTFTDNNFIAPVGPDRERSKSYWIEQGQNTLRDKLNAANNLNKNKAKNIIIFIGDGMSLATIMATRVYLGGEAEKLAFEKFPYTGLAKTYCVNTQVADSACTANAIFSGVKINSATLGVSAQVDFANQTAVHENPDVIIENIFNWAHEAGKSTGLVTTQSITDATPAAAYAKTPNRAWQSDVSTPPGYIDIAQQLVHGYVGKNIRVLMGGGRSQFTPTTLIDSYDGYGGYRTDNRNLIEEWLIERQKDGEAVYVNDRKSLHQVNTSSTDYLLGLFQNLDMNFHIEANPAYEPTLAEMAEKALEVLSKNENGYIMLVEGGRIDIAHHNNLAHLALDETKEYHKAIARIKELTNEEDTLIISTSDHAHTMTIGGYPMRGNNIFGQGDVSLVDGMPFFTLNYANGMGYLNHINVNQSRINPLEMDWQQPSFVYPAAVPTDSETHGGEDVAVYAVGPWAHLLTGNYEQNYIAHAIMYASCLGHGEKGDFCGDSKSESARLSNPFNVVIFIIVAFYIYNTFFSS